MYRLSLSHEVYTNSNADVNVAVTHFLAVQNLQLCSTYYVWRAAIKPSSNLKCSTANNLRSLSQAALLASCCFFSPHQQKHLRHAEWQCGARNERRRRTRFRSPPGRGLPMFWKTGDCFLWNFAAPWTFLEWRRCCHWPPGELCARTEL